jgi:hypothetical protein
MHLPFAWTAGLFVIVAAIRIVWRRDNAPTSNDSLPSNVIDPHSLL